MEETFAIGLMSGTSLDGLDIVYCKFWKNKKNTLEFQIISAHTYPYPTSLKDQLQSAYSQPNSVEELHKTYGKYLGEKVNTFIEEYHVEKIKFIASHGHTIFHQPKSGLTLQIGDGQQIADITHLPVVFDFRTQDVALGGQGAPLVPMGDLLLFSQYDACLNLGGFSNISFQEDGRRIAFDIGPVNIVLNHYVEKLGLNFDDKGKIACSGTLIPSLFKALNSLKYYEEKPPKSLGKEWVDENIIPLISETHNVQDVLHTFTQHIGFQINIVFEKYHLKKILITGGGAYNDYLVSLLPSDRIILPQNQLIDYKEALLFALLGHLKLQNEHNILSSVTGASRDHCSGSIAYPKKG